MDIYTLAAVKEYYRMMPVKWMAVPYYRENFIMTSLILSWRGGASGRDVMFYL